MKTLISDKSTSAMKLVEFGNCPQRNVHCWHAITEAIDEWIPKCEGATLEAHFHDETLKFVFKEPGKTPKEASVDISWIAYADQAERLGILTRMALVDIDLERIAAPNLGSQTNPP